MLLISFSMSAFHCEVYYVDYGILRLITLLANDLLRKTIVCLPYLKSTY